MVRLNRLNQLMDRGKVVEGSWLIGRDHEIRYRRAEPEQEAIFTGNLVGTRPNRLVIQLSEKSTEERILQRIFALRGRWEADAKNRLTFLVERERGRTDRLTLQGGWEVGEGQEILYRFVRWDLKRKSRRLQTLTFRGRWEIEGPRELTYTLDADSDSAFRFRGTFQTPVILAKSGEIRYQVGVELEGKRRLQTVTLFGKWKLSRKLALEFEIPYRSGSRRGISFGATFTPDSGRSVSAKLTGRRGEPLGAEVLLTREFLQGQGEAFLRLRKSLEETAAEGGFRFRW
ncbi:MAG: hypothetical protein HYZ90_07010 [Candidatus Omnitrophica bacterium]|nr:hypothetical protein [Candidatus Omnitrophota bacterium]